MIRNKLMLILAMLALSLGVKADWKDVTSVFITNPGFDNNSSKGWTWTSNASSQTLRAECMEFWNGTFDIWQDIKDLPQGHYRLSVQAYYRPTDNDASYSKFASGDYEGDMTGYLYAGSSEQKIVSVYTFEFPYWVEGCWTYTSGGWWGGGETHYFPNTMESAAEAFLQGGYQNVMEFDADGSARIGLRCANRQQGNWCIFDNFKLEFSGDIVEVQSISLSSEKTELVVGETLSISAKITPENALNKVLNWSSSDASVATVDQTGLVTALAEGTVTIKATSTDGSKKSASVTLKIKRNEVVVDQLFINEIMVSNVDEMISPAFNFDSWIEFYNASDAPVSLSGMYLSDDATDPMKWRMPVQVGVVPAKGYKVVWCGSNDLVGTNAPFELDVDGGFVHLSDENGKLMLSQYYPSGVERVSYARTTDGGEVWSTTGQPTPGESNTRSAFANTQLAAPLIDQPSKLFDGPFTATVTIPVGTTLRYTLDGSLPTEENGSVSKTGIFQISSTTNLRLRLYAEGSLPSRVTTRSYILRNKNYYLPVVSVVGDDDFFNSTEIGVFKKGPNGRPGNGQAENCNWNMNWERPVNFSYIEADGEMVLNQDVNLEMCGGWSRAWLPHSFKLKGSKEMGGNKHLPYTFFTQKPYIRNRTIQIRNGGNENTTRLKDAALGYILQTSGMDVDVQGYQPIHEFINGKYIGVLNVREPNNKHYVYANYGWDDDEIDQFEIGPDSGYAQKCGTADSFEELIILSESAANSETYEELCRRIDMDEYVNYMAVEFYLGGTDWPQNNVKGFALKDNGKYRFVFFDVDFAFNSNDPFNLFMEKEWYLFNELYPAGQERIYDQIKFVTLFKNLLANDQFRRKFIDAFCLVGGSVYETSRATEIIDMLANNVNPAMQLENISVIGVAQTLKNNLSNRLTMATNYLKNYYQMELEDNTAQNVTLASDVDAAQLLVNGQQVPMGYFNGKLFQPVTLTAVAPAGYTFQGWMNVNGTLATKMLKAMGSSWSYYDQGSLDGKNWTANSYNASSWSSGNAPLGYSNTAGIITTTLDYGNSSSSKRPTYYFRSSVTLSQAPASTDVFTMDYYIDDGLVVYVNGTEAARFNMPSGTISYSTLASTYADQFPTGTLTLPTSLFKKGTNVIAVEVHNNANNSSDIIFDADIKMQFLNGSGSYYSTEEEIELPEGNVNLKACYRELTEQERQEDGMNPVRINEVSGSNNSLINEYGKKSDWVELYNTTDQDIDVEGMYLTDNMSKPEKYKITKGTTQAKTIIPAHGFLLIWCDKLATTDQGLHATFKIDGEGGVIALKAADKSWTDEVYYGAHDANTTVGRYPDGGTDIYMMNVTTIAAPNLLTSYMELTDQEELKIATGTRMTIASANGFRVRFGSQQLLIKSEDATSADVAIYTPDGRIVERAFVDLYNGTARLSVAHLPAGFYVVRATDEQGNHVGCKFMR